VIQLFDIFNIRFGATLVGPTGAGKSTCYRILSAIMINLRNKGSKSELFQVGIIPIFCSDRLRMS
jgi:dynein heavy chain